jgi:hypothetical protein
MSVEQTADQPIPDTAQELQDTRNREINLARLRVEIGSRSDLATDQEFQAVERFPDSKAAADFLHSNELQPEPHQKDNLLQRRLNEYHPRVRATIKDQYEAIATYPGLESFTFGHLRPIHMLGGEFADNPHGWVIIGFDGLPDKDYHLRSEEGNFLIVRKSRTPVPIKKFLLFAQEQSTDEIIPDQIK